MPVNKKIKNLTDYTSVLPYSSEMFGVYQPLIGWKSKRMLQRINRNIASDNIDKLKILQSNYKGHFKFDINVDNYLESLKIDIGKEKGFLVKPQSESILLHEIANQITEMDVYPINEQWLEVINEESILKILNTKVSDTFKKAYEEFWQSGKYEEGKSNLEQALNRESIVAGALMGYASRKLYENLQSLFLRVKEKNSIESIFESIKQDFKDPYLTFDPKKDIEDVSLSPVGIVHLYRQYFFELDTFLGTPVSHVWLSPGSSVELIETSTRKTLTEKTYETSIESTTKTEKSTTEQDEISDAVKQDNKDDMKLGFSTTVNQSWGTGNISATGSLNLDKTQQIAREHTQKRSRQQTTKLSTEIRQNFKSTFKTITEVTDTTSKRYVLNNNTPDLINYELRRKMRQVGVQIQDIGSYLCWETFVDEPGINLGLPNLVHIAQPADLVFVPNPKTIDLPTSPLSIGFTGEMEWFFPENKVQFNDPLSGFFKMNTIDIPQIPDGYRVANSGTVIDISQEVIMMEDNDSEFFKGSPAKGRITNDGLRVEVGLVLGPIGLRWNEGRIRFKVNGSILCELTPERISNINKQNNDLLLQKEWADNENERRVQEAYKKTAKERITLASKIKKRKFEDLREEERTIVYRNLIRSLMTEKNYKDTPGDSIPFATRHVLSELINSIFDIDKMLYFVAPEWWKPRNLHKSSLLTRMFVGHQKMATLESINGTDLNWANQPARLDNYYITEDSEPAPLGSSLGWLLQLDGDDLRNAFLNAPWVKAVIPIRPGKEQAAIAWLQNVGVEGSEGLETTYYAPDEELIRINVFLDTGKVPRQFSDTDWTAILQATDANPVTIKQALEFLCAEVANKEDLSKIVSKHPKEEIDDDNKILSTPIEKVYEHGFYPLKGGFKAVVEDYFETISQWIEVLPTDQVVPVEIKYDSKTGRQI